MSHTGNEPRPADKHAWARAGADPVAEGVWRIPLPLPGDALRAVNVYAIADENGFTLIDGGWALDSARGALAAALGELGAQLGDIRRFLVTHIHRDHYTQALTIRREFGSKVLLGEGEKPGVARLTDPAYPSLRAYRLLLERHGAASVIEALRSIGVDFDARDKGYEAPDEWITDGESFALGDRILEAVATPGHTRGHVVFIDRGAGLMFAGDHVLPHITPSVAFESEPDGLALGDYLGSLHAVTTLPDLRLLPAHGPVTASVHDRVAQLLAHHDDRLDATADALAHGAETAFAVASHLTWTSRGRALGDLDPLNRMLAVCETVLHLNLLVAQGRAVAHDTGATVSYGSLRDH